jgi:hypothetical protein
VPDNCVKHITKVGQLVRDNRRMFFHAGCFHKFRGYASAQMAKLKNGINPLTEFMNVKKVPASVTLNDIEAEMVKRGLK